MVYNLRTGFFPDMQFSQNHIVNYGASFKAQKVMMPSLNWQILPLLVTNCLVFTQLSRKQIQFSKI